MSKQPRDTYQSLVDILDLLVVFGDVLILAAHTFIVSLGVPLVLVLALVVEQQRVQHGLALFEQDANLTLLGSWVLVLINVVFEIQAHHVEQRAGYKAPESKQFSFRLLFRRAQYVIGVGKGWEERMQSPARRYYQVGAVVTLTILALALAGSMRAQLMSAEGAWHEALLSVLTSSTLADMTTWAGGLLFALAAVVSAQASSRYVATRVVEIRNQMTYRRRSVSATPGRRTASSASGRLSVLSEQTDAPTDIRQTARAAYGHTRTPDGQQRVVQHLVENPSDAALPLRALGERVGVNKDTAAAGRRLWQAKLEADTPAMYDNGHGG